MTQESEYHWTVASALFQLRWEPTERRASAVEYLKETIKHGDITQMRGIAYVLLGMASDLIAAEEPPDPESPANKDFRDDEEEDNQGPPIIGECQYCGRRVERDEREMLVDSNGEDVCDRAPGGHEIGEFYPCSHEIGEFYS